MKVIATVITALSFMGNALASDHIDGPVTTEHAASDITDLFAFPTPAKPGYLTVIFNTYPIVPSDGHFADKIKYNIILRQAAIAGQGNAAAFSTSKKDQLLITCQFKTPHEHEDHKFSCQGFKNEIPWGQPVAGGVNTLYPAEDNSPMTVFAGLRSDPFFFNAGWATSASNDGKIEPPEDSNTMSKINALSIVLELKMSDYFKDGKNSLYAIAGQTLTQDRDGAQVRQLDRIGRPEITNVTMVSHDNTDYRDDYNQQTPFEVAAAQQKIFKQRIFDNVLYFDNLDSVKNWTDDRAAALSELLVNDFLVVDINKSCHGDDFFAIEMAMLNNQPQTSCGGRKLTDDIMDRLFTLYINADQGAMVRDGVDAPYRKVSKEFPYLVEPDVSMQAKLKGWFARLALNFL
ncbi:MAG: DUF4331 family protein [Algicola sp.]|nr:DUF4331 family protein [Algicola sp.]